MLRFALLCLLLPLASTGSLIAAESDAVVAVVAGQAITLEEVDANGSSQVRVIKDQLHWAREASARELIARRLLAAEAKERGLSVSEFEELEITSKIDPVTDADLAAFWKANPSTAPSDQQAELSGRLKSYLALERSLPVRAALLQRLSEKHAPGMKLAIPTVRVELDLAGRPVMGDREALVTLVTFTDYQCAGCAVLVGDLKALERSFDGNLRVVHVDYPSEGHEHAIPAAVAARCAGRFGKFWDYHDKIFLEKRELSEQGLTDLAGELGLDAEGFADCRALPEVLAGVEADKALGQSLGVVGTPHVYLNGLSLDGGLNTQRLGQLIAMELDRLGIRPPAGS